MNRIINVFILSILCFSVSAQVRNATIQLQPQTNNVAAHAANKTNASGDSTTLSNITNVDSVVAYKYMQDSGFVYGTNLWGDKGFAERFVYTSSLDDSLVVYGVMAHFTGKYNPTSTDSIVIRLWSVGDTVAFSPTVAYNGYPEVCTDSLQQSVTQLGIGTTRDTLKSYFFATPDSVQRSFFAGFTYNYRYGALNGDTIGLASSKRNTRIGSIYNIVRVDTSHNDSVTLYYNDTVYNVQNATLWSDNTWHENYTQSNGILNNLAVFPIVKVLHPMAVPSVHAGNLALGGCFPNPANNELNIRYSLQQQCAVSVTICDLSGKAIAEFPANNCVAGSNLLTINVSNLTKGDYIYVINAGGTRLAELFTISGK